MASNLACIGLDVGSRGDFDALISSLLDDATSIGRAGRTEVFRWQDPSGARVVIEVHAGAVEGVIPGYDALAGATVTELRSADDDVAIGSIVDDGGGEEITRLALELEERRLVLGRRRTYAGALSIVGLGRSVEFFDDADAFATSPASLVYTDADHVPEPPPHVVEFGLAWPPRMAAQSLVSYGVFAEPHDVDAYARVNGTVLGASTRTVERTGQSFHAVRVRTVGFDLEICLSVGEHPDLPRTGQVVGGSVLLVGSIGDGLAARRGRSRAGRG